MWFPTQFRVQGVDFRTILRASKTVLVLRYVLPDEKLFWKAFDGRYDNFLLSYCKITGELS